jgi:SAM-dependent methyltransferase
MAEINLLENYPQAKRNVDERGAQKTEEDRRIGRQFGQEYFDGDRKYGYGGYKYNPKFWQPVIPTIADYYGLGAGSKVLDVGCGKGFMLHDFVEGIPEIEVAGIDISQYAIDNALEDMKPFLRVGNAVELPFPDKSFDLVISINTIHNLPPEDCKKALKEIQRVTCRDAFVTVDAYRDEEEKKRMDMWNLTALTYMSVEEWKKFFADAGYEGDYYWFIP